MQHSSTQKFTTKRYIIKYVSRKISSYDTALLYLHKSLGNRIRKHPFADPLLGDTYATRAIEYLL